MTAKSTTAQKNHVERKNNRAHADAETFFASSRISKPHRFPYIVSEHSDKQDRHVEKEAVHILHNERKRFFAAITFPRFANGASRRVSPKRLVVSAAIIIARQSKSPGRPENEQRGRERQP